VAKAVSSRHVRLVLLSNSYHMISIDRERSRVLGEMQGFLGEHLKRDEEMDTPPARRSGHRAAIQNTSKDGRQSKSSLPDPLRSPHSDVPSSQPSLPRPALSRSLGLQL